jgi:hypothetical protein
MFDDGPAGAAKFQTAETRYKSKNPDRIRSSRLEKGAMAAAEKIFRDKREIVGKEVQNEVANLIYTVYDPGVRELDYIKKNGRRGKIQNQGNGGIEGICGRGKENTFVRQNRQG